MIIQKNVFFNDKQHVIGVCNTMPADKINLDTFSSLDSFWRLSDVYKLEEKGWTLSEYLSKKNLGQKWGMHTCNCFHLNRIIMKNWCKGFYIWLSSFHSVSKYIIVMENNINVIDNFLVHSWPKLHYPPAIYK